MMSFNHSSSLLFTGGNIDDDCCWLFRGVGNGISIIYGFLHCVKLQVQEAMEEIGSSGIPLSVVAKAAEIQLLYAVDRVLLGSRWFRKATGIQPKLPYLVDSFEKRYASVVFLFLT